MRGRITMAHEQATRERILRDSREAREAGRFAWAARPIWGRRA